MPLAVLIRLADISTHALRMEGDLFSWQKNKRLGISTHALRMEGDILRF